MIGTEEAAVSAPKGNRRVRVLMASHVNSPASDAMNQAPEFAPVKRERLRQVVVHIAALKVAPVEMNFLLYAGNFAHFPVLHEGQLQALIAAPSG